MQLLHLTKYEDCFSGQTISFCLHTRPESVSCIRRTFSSDDFAKWLMEIFNPVFPKHSLAGHSKQFNHQRRSVHIPVKLFKRTLQSGRISIDYELFSLIEILFLIVTMIPVLCTRKWTFFHTWNLHHHLGTHVFLHGHQRSENLFLAYDFEIILSPSFQVLIQGWKLTCDNVDRFLSIVNERLVSIISLIASITARAIEQREINIKVIVLSTGFQTQY